MSVFNDDILLIHAPKAAGTSCRDYLLAYLPNAIDSIGPKGGPLPIDSVPLRHIEEYTGRPLNSWQKIVIPIREPHAHAVSHWCYHWDRFARGGRHVHDLTAAMNKTLTAWLLDPMSDFRVWYESAVRQQTIGDAVATIDGVGFFEYYATIDGEIPDNVEILLTEDIGETFPQAVAPYIAGEPNLFPHTHRSPHQASKTDDYYTPTARSIVVHRYRWAFEHFYKGSAA